MTTSMRATLAFALAYAPVITAVHGATVLWSPVDPKFSSAAHAWLFGLQTLGAVGLVCAIVGHVVARQFLVASGSGPGEASPFGVRRAALAGLITALGQAFVSLLPLTLRGAVGSEWADYLALPGMFYLLGDGALVVTLVAGRGRVRPAARGEEVAV